MRTCLRACVRACVLVCVRAYVRACVRACVHVSDTGMKVFLYSYILLNRFTLLAIVSTLPIPDYMFSGFESILVIRLLFIQHTRYGGLWRPMINVLRVIMFLGKTESSVALTMWNRRTRLIIK